MKPPKLKDLENKARKRSETLRDSETGLLSTAEKLQRRLNAYILNFLLPGLEYNEQTNTIKNTNANLKKINEAKGLKRFLKNVVNLGFLEYYEKQFNKIDKNTLGYFNLYEPNEATNERILNRGGTVTGGFLDELFDNNQISRSLQNTIRNAILSEQNRTDVKKLLTEQIKGKADKLGILQSYHYENGLNEFQAYSRSLDEQFSKALKLNYAIYAGGEIQTTRVFCDERNGNVYNREEILSWDSLEWQGKKPDNNILIDLGGYNCRHDLEWISYELAQILNPDIQKSKFDE
jgi:hypothetical protein